MVNQYQTILNVLLKTYELHLNFQEQVNKPEISSGFAEFCQNLKSTPKIDDTTVTVAIAGLKKIVQESNKYFEDSDKLSLDFIDATENLVINLASYQEAFKKKVSLYFMPRKLDRLLKIVRLHLDCLKLKEANEQIDFPLRKKSDVSEHGQLDKRYQALSENREKIELSVAMYKEAENLLGDIKSALQEKDFVLTDTINSSILLFIDAREDDFSGKFEEYKRTILRSAKTEKNKPRVADKVFDQNFLKLKTLQKLLENKYAILSQFLGKIDKESNKGNFFNYANDNVELIEKLKIHFKGYLQLKENYLKFKSDYKSVFGNDKLEFLMNEREFYLNELINIDNVFNAGFSSLLKIKIVEANLDQLSAGLDGILRKLEEEAKSSKEKKGSLRFSISTENKEFFNLPFPFFKKQDKNPQKIGSSLPVDKAVLKEKRLISRLVLLLDYNYDFLNKTFPKDKAISELRKIFEKLKKPIIAKFNDIDPKLDAGIFDLKENFCSLATYIGRTYPPKSINSQTYAPPWQEYRAVIRNVGSAEFNTFISNFVDKLNKELALKNQPSLELIKEIFVIADTELSDESKVESVAAVTAPVKSTDVLLSPQPAQSADAPKTSFWVGAKPTGLNKLASNNNNNTSKVEVEPDQGSSPQSSNK